MRLLPKIPLKIDQIRLTLILNIDHAIIVPQFLYLCPGPCNDLTQQVLAAIIVTASNPYDYQFPYDCYNCNDCRDRT